MSASGTLPTAAELGTSIKCVFCLDTGSLDARQVLQRSSSAYLAAPLGQVVEGFLTIAPYRCVSSLSQLAAEELADVVALQTLARRFLDVVYGVKSTICYEQGRGGDGSRLDSADGFPLHAHLCILPVTPPLGDRLAESARSHLKRHFRKRQLSALNELPRACSGQPYLYLEAPYPTVFTGRNDVERRELSRARLKLLLTDLAGVPARANWRTCPGYEELNRLIQNWSLPWQLDKSLPR
jgi:diadenosine tetraphosphate (Ap4A) HIT family hydrolase